MSLPFGIPQSRFSTVWFRAHPHPSQNVKSASVAPCLQYISRFFVSRTRHAAFPAALVSHLLPCPSHANTRASTNVSYALLTLKPPRQLLFFSFVGCHMFGMLAVESQPALYDISRKHTLDSHSTPPFVRPSLQGTDEHL